MPYIDMCILMCMACAWRVHRCVDGLLQQLLDVNASLLALTAEATALYHHAAGLAAALQSLPEPTACVSARSTASSPPSRHLPRISPASPPHLGGISPAPRPHLGRYVSALDGLLASLAALPPLSDYTAGVSTITAAIGGLPAAGALLGSLSTLDAHLALPPSYVHGMLEHAPPACVHNMCIRLTRARARLQGTAASSTSPSHLPRISPASRLYLACISAPRHGGVVNVSLALAAARA